MNEDTQEVQIEEIETPRLLKRNQETDQITDRLSLSTKPLPQDKELSLDLETKIKNVDKILSLLEESKSQEGDLPEEETLIIQIPPKV